MKKDYIPLTIRGEDVIVDYQNEEVIFPNRSDSNKLDPDVVSKISIYLKREGFLDCDLVEKSDV